MHTEIAFFAAYLLLFLLGIAIIGRFQWDGLPLWMSVLIAVAKVAISYGYGVFYTADVREWFAGSAWLFRAHDESWWAYARLVFGPNDTYLPPHLYRYAYLSGYWQDGGVYFIQRLHALWRLFSGGYYSVHCLLMAVLVYASSMVLHRWLLRVSYLSSWAAAAVVLCVPSCAFFSAGLHKDGLVYVGLSFGITYSYEIRRRLAQLRVTPLHKTTAWVADPFHNFFAPPQYEYLLGMGRLAKAAVLAVVSIGAVLLVRPFLAGLVLPAFVAFVVWEGFVKLPFRVRLAVLFAGVAVAGFGFAYIDGAATMIAHQSAFADEVGVSNIAPLGIRASIFSLVAYTPLALFRALFMPYFWCTHFSIVARLMGLESWLLLVVGGWVVWTVGNKKSVRGLLEPTQSGVEVWVLFAVFYLVLIGLMTTNAGTLVRYRSIPLGFLWLSAAGWYFARRTHREK